MDRPDPTPTAGRAGTGRDYRRVLARLGTVAVVLASVGSPVRAHSGTTHAGTPHWALLALLVGGVAVILGTAVAVRRGRLSAPGAGLSVTVGAVIAVLGAIGLVEIQVVGASPPRIVDLYPLLSLAVSGVLAVGGLLVTTVRYPTRPRYAVLCLVLAAWVGYPAVMPDGGYFHPLGYLVVLSLPVLLAHILRTDARGVLQGLRLRRTPKLAGVGAGLLTGVFFAFSAGTMTFDPDRGTNVPTEAFVTGHEVASPLVVWPAVEWYVPSVPFAGYVSVGTVLLMGVLGGLVGLNAAVVTQQWTGTGSVAGKQLFSGSLAASGATACCCCAPAFYGVLSVLFGAAATPVYWSFLLPASPVGASFFAASVLLLLGSFLRSTGPSPPDRPASRPAPE